jgi:hypothetical protein
VRKLFVAAIAAAVVVAGFSVIATAGTGDAGTSWDFSFKPKKVKKPASSSSLIQPAKIDDQGTEDRSDDVYTPPEKTTILFTKGSSVDTGALARCSNDDARTGSCPDKTKLGDGEAVSVVGGTPTGNGQVQGGSDVNATIEAFNQKGKILFVVQPCQTGTGPTTGTPCAPAGSPILLQGTWSKVATRPTLVVPTPPGLLDINVVITRFKLDTDKHTKTVKVKGKEVLRSYVFTPEDCGGKWKSQAKVNYTDGTSQTIKDNQKCKKPA